MAGGGRSGPERPKTGRYLPPSPSRRTARLLPCRSSPHASFQLHRGVLSARARTGRRRSCRAGPRRARTRTKRGRVHGARGSRSHRSRPCRPGCRSDVDAPQGSSGTRARCALFDCEHGADVLSIHWRAAGVVQHIARGHHCGRRVHHHIRAGADRDAAGQPQSPPPRARREGRRSVSSPLPARRPPPPIERTVAPPEPPPLASEPLPALVAPIIVVASDNRDRIGVLQEAKMEAPSRGPGQGGGVGAGKGTGIGEGDGAGLGEGAGGGTGGGPFRPGSGIDPPRLLREIKADYSDAARRQHIEGEVVLEIIVRRDGTVGDVKMLRRLGAGLDERAVQAVRQWRFAPATRRGSPVDVVVEVAVDFRLR